VKSHIENPQHRIAYTLWTTLETAFQRPLEEERRDLWCEFIALNAKDLDGDREFIKKFQNTRMKLTKIGSPLNESFLMDHLYIGVSKRYKDFIQ